MAEADDTISATDDTEQKLEGGEPPKPSDVADRWLKELAAADRHEKDWRERAQKIVDLYRDERKKAEGETSHRYNILYANTEVLKGALYSRCPAPDVRRRFLDKDPVSRVAALVLQRALVATLDQQKDGEDFDCTMKDSVFDMVVPGRAVARVKYVPTINAYEERQAVDAPADGSAYPADVEQDEQGYFRMAKVEEVTYECVGSEYVEWAMFRYSPAKRWKKVRWVAFGELLTRDDCIREFGAEKGKAVELKWMPKGVEDTEENQVFKRALCWTIWNKTQRRVIVVSEGYKEAPLKEQDDPLGLEDFFPMPKPLYSIFSTDSMVPVPEYAIYQDHALQLDALEERIAVLTDALRRRGVWDASIPELEQLAQSADNNFVPVKDYAQFVEKGGLGTAYQEFDIAPLAKVLAELMLQAEAKKAQIYEIIGISDIMRGATNAGETLGAQKIKDQWGSVRVGPRQGDVQRFARDLLRLMAEVIAEHFSAKTLATMTGVQLFETKQEKAAAAALVTPPVPGQPAPPADIRLKRPTWEEVLAVLKSDKLRGFKVDIETDSTIKPQADDEQKNRVDLLTGMSGLMEKLAPAVQTGAMPMKVALGLLQFGMRGFKAGGDLEEMIDEWAGDGIDEEQGQQPDPRAQQQMQALQQQVQELQPQADKNALAREQIQFGREELRDKQAERETRKAEAAAATQQKETDAAMERDLRDRETAHRNRELETSAETERQKIAAKETADLGAPGNVITEALARLEQGMAALAEAQVQLAQQQAAQLQQMTTAIVEAVSSEKEIVRDPKGRATGMRVKQPAVTH